MRTGRVRPLNAVLPQRDRQSRAEIHRASLTSASSSLYPGFNRCVSVSNWLFTTSPQVKLSRQALVMLTERLVERFGDLPIVFRGLDLRVEETRRLFEDAGPYRVRRRAEDRPRRAKVPLAAAPAAALDGVQGRFRSCHLQPRYRPDLTALPAGWLRQLPAASPAVGRACAASSAVPSTAILGRPLVSRRPRGRRAVFAPSASLDGATDRAGVPGRNAIPPLPARDKPMLLQAQCSFTGMRAGADRIRLQPRTPVTTVNGVHGLWSRGDSPLRETCGDNGESRWNGSCCLMHMQHSGTLFGALLPRVQFWATLALALGACSDESDCDASFRDCLYEQAAKGAQEDDDTPCGQLGEEDCRRSGRCFLDSVCAAPECNGFNCSDHCELVHVCVAN